MSQQPKKVIVYLVRHGESKGNIERAFIPHTEDLLTDKGKNQATALGVHLAEVQFTRAYSSTYARTNHTAKLVIELQRSSEKLDIEDVIQDGRIRERHMGIFEGKSYREVVMAIMKSQKPIIEFVVPEGETSQDVNSRAKEFLKDVLGETLNSANPEETILIVSHALFLNALMHYFADEEQTGQDFQILGFEDHCKKMMTNTAYMKFEVTKTDNQKISMRFLQIHEKSHLNESHESGGKDDLAKFIEANPEARFLANCIQA